MPLSYDSLTSLSFVFLLLFCFITSYVLIYGRGENGELRVGVRRLMRQLSNMPSSVISSHSMHLGVLATASHALSTGTLFSVFYKPRFDCSSQLYNFYYIYKTLHRLYSFSFHCMIHWGPIRFCSLRLHVWLSLLSK